MKFSFLYLFHWFFFLFSLYTCIIVCTFYSFPPSLPPSLPFIPSIFYLFKLCGSHTQALSFLFFYIPVLFSLFFSHVTTDTHTLTPIASPFLSFSSHARQPRIHEACSLPTSCLASFALWPGHIVPKIWSRYLLFFNTLTSAALGFFSSYPNHSEVKQNTGLQKISFSLGQECE